jgi:hypothetical protein
MTGRPVPKDIVASVRQRLLNKARESNRSFNELPQYYARERFLLRLGVSEHAKKLVLEGALVFMAWGTPLSQPTTDIDLLGRTDNAIDEVNPGMSLTRSPLSCVVILASEWRDPWPNAIIHISGLNTFTCALADHSPFLKLCISRYLDIH